MPPRKFKVQHHRDRRVAGFDEVAQRNAKEDEPRDERPSGYAKSEDPPVASKSKGGKKKEEEPEEKVDSDDGVVFGEEEKPKTKGPVGIETMNPNEGKQHMVDRDGVQMSRKQKEAMEKEAARRRYEELHKQGKTDEAKADLARLEEVKARREAAKKEKEEKEAAEKAAQAAKSNKGGMGKEVKEALGGEEARLRGQRSKEKKDKDKAKDDKDEDGPKRGAGNDDEIYVAYAVSKPTEKVDQGNLAAGSMASCKAMEEDFM